MELYKISRNPRVDINCTFISANAINEEAIVSLSTPLGAIPYLRDVRAFWAAARKCSLSI